MLIVSQDKETIINFENITRISIMPPQEEEYKYSISINSCLDLGYYKTKERAKEVLQEIVNKFKEYVTITNVAGNDIRGIYNIPKIYEMPKE